MCNLFRTATLSGMYAHNLDDQHRGIKIYIYSYIKSNLFL